MPIHYTTTTGEPPNGGRIPGQRPSPRGTPGQGPPPAPSGYIPHPPMPVPQFSFSLGPPPPYTAPKAWACFPTQAPVPKTPSPAPPMMKCVPVQPARCAPKPAPPPQQVMVCHPVAPLPPKSQNCSCCKSAPPPPPPPPPPPAPCCGGSHRTAPPDTSDIPGTKIHPKATVLSPPMTLIHLIQKGVNPWLNKGMKFDWTLHEVPTSVTIKELIEVIRPEGDDCRGEGIVETIEMGGGKWVKGTQFRIEDERSLMSLKGVGWGPTKGRQRKPVWIAYG